MPRIQIQMLKGRTTEQKRQLARGVVDAAVQALGIPKERFTVAIFEMEQDQLAPAGELWCDKKIKPPI